MSAVHCGHKTTASLLIERGADANYASEYGMAPLQWCATENKIDMAVLLLDAGADIEVRGLRGSTSLHFAVDGRYKAMAKILLERGADVQAVIEVRCDAIDTVLNATLIIINSET